jgi:hypothetical protein
MRDFHLVARLYESPRAADEKSLLKNFEGKVNPFGGGRMGDYQIDYMGAAEYEFGAIGRAMTRMSEAEELVRTTVTGIDGKAITAPIDFLYRSQDGPPIDDWIEWLGRKRGPYELKAKADNGEFLSRLAGREFPSINPTVIWWAIEANVFWSFAPDRHIDRMLKSMSDAGPEGVVLTR